MSENTQNGKRIKQSPSTDGVANGPSTGGSAVPRRFAITATLAPNKHVAVQQTVSGGIVASEKSNGACAAGGGNIATKKPNGACAAGGGSVATKKPNGACAAGGGGDALPKNSATVSKDGASPPSKEVMSKADKLQAMIDKIVLEDEKKTSESKSKSKKLVSADLQRNAWTAAEHTGFIQQTKEEAELLRAISRQSDEVRREAERAEKEAQKKAERAKKAEEDRIAQLISLEAAEQWKHTSKILNEHLENAISKSKAPKFAIIQKAKIMPTSELFSAFETINAELAKLTAEINELKEAIEFHGECPETFEEIQAREAKARIKNVKAMRDSHHVEVDDEFNKSNPNAPISLFKKTVTSFMPAEDGEIKVVFFGRFSHQKIGTFENVSVDPDVFAKIFLRTKDVKEISVFTVDHEKKIVSISKELMAHMRGTYKQNPKLPFGEYLFYAMREAVYYFLTKFAKQVAFVQRIQLWQLFTNVRRLDEKVTEEALEQREDELRELWASVASSRQSVSQAETTAPPSNQFHVLADTVDCSPEDENPAPAAPLKRRGRGGQSGGSARPIPSDAENIERAREVIHPMLDTLVPSVGGIASDLPAYTNPTSFGNPEAFRQFMAAIPLEIRANRERAIEFLQRAGLIAREITVIPTKNGRKNVFLFLDVHGEPLRREDPVPRFVPAARDEFTAETATFVAVSAVEFVPVSADAADGSNSTVDADEAE